MFWSTYLLWQCHFLHKGKNSLRYWRSFMTVGRPTAHWAPKKKKKIFGRRKIVPIIHPNICDWVITSSHVKMCTITFIEVTSHWVGTISLYICYDISITLQESGGGAGRCRGELSAPPIVFDVLPQLLIIVCVFRCFPLVHQVWNCSSRLFISHYF